MAAAHLVSYYTNENSLYNALMDPCNVAYIYQRVGWMLEDTRLFDPYELINVHTVENVRLVIIQFFNNLYNKPTNVQYINNCVIHAMFTNLYAEKVDRIKKATQNVKVLEFSGEHGMYQYMQPKINKRRPDPICTSIY